MTTAELAAGRAAARPLARPVAGMRERWRTSVEARALIMCTATLLAFGLATLYSASAMVAIQSGFSSTHFLLRQLSGIAVGVLLFMFAAKQDADWWSRMAWPLMIGAIFLMLLCVLPFTRSIARSGCPPASSARAMAMRMSRSEEGSVRACSSTACSSDRAMS